MEEVLAGGAPKVEVSDITGLWEVVRIEKAGEIIVYPWIQGRFMFNFQDNGIFVCIKSRKHSDGTWELTQSGLGSERKNEILLNETFLYDILEIDEDEMIISDYGIKYILTRKLWPE